MWESKQQKKVFNYFDVNKRPNNRYVEFSINAQRHLLTVEEAQHLACWLLYESTKELSNGQQIYKQFLKNLGEGKHG